MEKKRLFALLSICLFAIIASSLSASAAYKELMHDVWHEHNDNFTLDNIYYKIKAGGTFNKVVISAGEHIVVIENGTCIDKANRSFCLADLKYPPVDLHKEYDPDDYEYKVQVWYYLANLSINKDIEERELLIGESIRVKIELKNDGSIPASGIYFKDVYFSDSYPDFFISNVVGGCTYSKHNITWTGSLKPTQTKKCSYDLKAVKATTFSSVAKVIYFVGIGNKTRTAESMTITITVPEYEIKTNRSINTTSVNIGEEIQYNATISNIVGDRKFNTVKFASFLPKGIEAISYTGWNSYSGNILRWTGSLEENESKNFSSILKVNYGGENTIRTNLNYNVAEIIRIIDEYDNVTGIMDQLQISYISLPNSITEGKSGKLNVNLINPSSIHEFKNIKSKITTNLSKLFEEQSFDNLGKHRFVNILNTTITAPNVENITHYKINFEIEYETEYGQILQINRTKQIVVNPKEIIQIPATKTGESAKEMIQEKLENIDWGKYGIGIVFFVAFFALSFAYYIKKITNKVSEYEKYEK